MSIQHIMQKRKYLRKTHLFSGVEDNIQIVTEANLKRASNWAGLQSTYNFNLCRSGQG